MNYNEGKLIDVLYLSLIITKQKKCPKYQTRTILKKAKIYFFKNNFLKEQQKISLYSTTL